MIAKLKKIQDALTSIEGLRVYHYWHPRLQAPFCIWAEDAEGMSIWQDNHNAEQVISGTIDYFTLKEFDETVELIQQALNETENVGWRLNSVQYEDETNLIHFEWEFDVI